MCAMHRVAVALNKGHPSSFYEQEGKANPVFQAFEQELQRFVAAVGKRSASGYKPNAKEPASKLSDALFNLWNNYQNRLPCAAWKRHMTELGDYLVCMQEYGLAMWQCYDRLLMKSFLGVSQTQLQSAEQFRQAFFLSGFDDTVDTTFALRALMGRLICSFHLTRLADPHLSQPGSIDECLQQLSFLQSILQWLLPKESLCWLVFNGTVHIYTISRYLMSFGHSNKVSDYLLWACMCMESSVPLLSVKYLTWRATLYAAVCQCYYDCKSSEIAESFARRALGKITELSEMEKMSDQPPSKEKEVSFRTATIKMAIMVFKRTVVESRRRPKGVLRPKNRLNVKDVSQGPWPRTVTEKLLVSMFEGSSAQVLALIEALTDSNRRTLMTSPPAPESDVEILDLYIEMFMAAQEVIIGGGGDCLKGASQKGGSAKLSGMDGIVPEQSLMQLAIKGENGIPLSCVVKLIKAAYCYQQFDFFDMWLTKTLNALQELQDPKLVSCEVELKILQAFDKAAGRSRNKKNLDPCPDEIGRPCNEDDLLHLATVLTSVITTSFPAGVELDTDMVSDALIFLWSKCKAVLQRFQNSVTNNPKYLEKIDNCDKWISILDKVYQVMAWCDLGTIDPVMVGEMALRLALLYEATSMQQMNASRHTDTDNQLEKTFNEVQLLSSGEPFNCSILANIQKAKDVLYSGLRNLSLSRDSLSMASGSTVADISWAKELNPELKLMGGSVRRSIETVSDGMSPRKQDNSKECLEAVSNMAKDLQTEMLFHYHRVCIKNARMSVLIGVCKDENDKTKVPWTLKSFQATDLHNNWNVSFDKSCDDLLRDCRQDKLSRSLFSMQKAQTFDSVGRSQDDKRKLLSEALNLLRQLEVEEKRLYRDSETSMEKRVPVESPLPPPPILIARTETSMTFKPPSYRPPDGQKVAWFRLFGHVISGSNLKARPNDIFLPGTGDEISVFDKEIRVTGLTGGEKYVFAVAAYSSDGELIGGSIGKSTNPILASHPSSLLSAWSFLAQVSYQLACHNIALEAFQVLWDHIVAPPVEVESEWNVRSIEQEDPKITVHRLNMKVISCSSPILLRSILSSLFVGVDVEMKERHLFCDVLTDRGPLTKAQMGRIRLCERLLLAVELAGWLNETGLALQLIVQCYGLLAPILYFKIASVPLIQVLERCVAVLQEIPYNVRQKYSPTTTDSLHHMTACMAYHLAKVLRYWGETNLASAFNDIGRKLLSLNYDPDKDRDATVVPGAQEEECGKENVAEEKRTASPISKRGSPVPRSPTASREKRLEMKSSTQSTVAKTDTKNTELSALEAHLVQLNKQAQPKFELSGNEDQSILHGFIMYLPSALAYKQLRKFKGRSRYLEFLIQVIQKGLAEGNAEMVATWCEEAEQTFGINAGKPSVKKGTSRQNADAGARGKGPDEEFTYRAAVVEYSRGGHEKLMKMGISEERVKQTETEREEKMQKKKVPNKPLGTDAPGSPSPGSARFQRQQLERKARATLKQLVTNWIRRRRKMQKQIRLISVDRPWRCQLGVLHGLCHFVALLNKLQSVNPLALDFVFRSTFLDLDLFHLENSRTLLNDGTGSPVEDGVIVKTTEVPSLTPIEVAADAIAGVVKKAEDNASSRTSKFEFGGSPRQQKYNRGKGAKVEEILSVTKDEMAAAVTKTFSYFTRAIVFAHRGRHWTLLQNICKDFWNCLQMVLIAAKTPDKNGNDLLDDESVHKVAWKPLFFAADCLLDMLVQTQEQLVKSWRTGSELTGQQQADDSAKSKADRLKLISATDDITSLDLHNVRRIAMRAVEMLHFQQMWEKLIDIGLRFNALTSNRYMEALSPVIAHAQHMLVARIIDNGGHPTLQPHFDEAVAKNEGRPIRSTDYVTLQLRVRFNKNILLQSVTGTEGDQRNRRALQLSSVPLDVIHSLQNLKQVLDKSSYSSRSLENSRKLLTLFLAGQHSVTSIEPSNPFVLREKLRGKSGIRLTEVPLDYDKSDKGEHQYKTTADIRSHPLCKSDIGLIITSYEKTIAALRLDGQMHLEAEALRELGNLQLFAGNLKAASKQWMTCMDLLLGSANVIYSWRSHFKYSSDIPSQLLNRCGVWGCLIGGIVCSNIAQYILTSDVAVQTDCCLLAGFMFKGLLRSSLPHPVNDRSYAKYRIQQGSEVIDLIPGVDILSDRFRCDGKTLVAAVRFITSELALRHHNLFVLPLMAIEEYFTSSVCRDVKRTVEGRIMRVRVLTDLLLLEEAGLILIELLYGDHLPQPFGSISTQAEQRTGPDRFNTRLPITEETNLCVLELISEKRLSANLRTLYGPHLTCQLALTQAHFLVAVASTIPVLPSEETITLSELTARKSAAKPEKPGKLLTVKSPSTKQLPDTSSIDLSISVRKRDIALDIVKARLLSNADQMLTTMSSALMDATKSTDGDQRFAECEVELVVQMKLEQASVAQQKHHSWMAARTIFSAMKILQDADCLKESEKKKNSKKKESLYGRKKTLPVSETLGKLANAKSEQFGDENFRSRTRLNGGLWLRCRLSLVKNLIDQVKGLGQIPGVDQQVKVELADVDVYCRCGLEEAEKLGDIEAQAEFLFLGAMLHAVVNGKPIQKTVHILHEVEQVLSHAKQLSTSGHLLLANVLIHKVDLLTLAETERTKSTWKEKVDKYSDIQSLLLSQLEMIGESVERRTDGRTEFSTLSSPVQNLYLPHLSVLVQTKLRIGHAMAQYAAEVAADIINSGMTADLWVQPLSLLDNALQLSYVIITRIQSVEAELLLYKGQVERQLCRLGKCESISVCRTLMVAIKTAIATDHNLSLIRQAYLELALVYLTQAPSEVDSPNAASERSLMEAKSSSSISSKGPKPKKTTKKERPEIQVAWAAISCASAVSKAQHDEQLITRAESSLLQSVGSAAVAEMPGFIGMDLIGSKVIGEKRKIYKNEIEEELGPLSESLNPTQPESYESQLNSVKEAASKISWTRIMAYQTMLQRLCKASAVNTVEDQLNETDPKHLTNNNNSKGGKCSESQLISELETEDDLASDHDVIKSFPFTASWTIRLHYVHKFLIKWVPSYADQCTAIYPPKFLDGWSEVVNPEGALPLTTYRANTIPDAWNMEEQKSGVELDSGNRSSKTSLVEPKVDQLCVQWYSPPLRQHSTTSGKKRVVLMYADFKRPKEFNVGIKIISLPDLLRLHKRLHILTRQDALSSEKSSQQPQEQNALDIKPDEFHQVLMDIRQLFSYQEDRRQCSVPGKSLLVPSSNKELEQASNVVLASSPTSSSSSVTAITSGGTQGTEFPFERSQLNLQCLEKLFDPSLGLTTTNKKMTTWLRTILC